MSKEAKLTAAELRASLEPEMGELLEEVAKAMNSARAGAIIADSEEWVREAMAVFRQKVYERAVQLIADKAAKAAFSPSAESAQPEASAEQGGAKS